MGPNSAFAYTWRVERWKGGRIMPLLTHREGGKAERWPNSASAHTQRGGKGRNGAQFCLCLHREGGKAERWPNSVSAHTPRGGKGRNVAQFRHSYTERVERRKVGRFLPLLTHREGGKGGKLAA